MRQKMSMEMIKLMASNNIKTALDDICNEHSMISTTVLEQVGFMKLDRYVVLNRENPEFLILVKALVEYAHASGKQTILEGRRVAEPQVQDDEPRRGSTLLHGRGKISLRVGPTRYDVHIAVG